jgi:hypothetical protein
MFLSNKQSHLRRFLLTAFVFLLTVTAVVAQVSSVEFGKNRIQYHKYNWRFYQTANFNVHFNQGGLELAKYVLQVAEEELPQLEAFTEIALQRRANIVLYNSYDDMKATNIGLGNDVTDVGGLTRLVNNKMILYFNGNHADLRRQIREGIARILVDNRLFGENIGEIAGNATLLDLPKWLTDGYVDYAAEPWSVQMDDALKNALLSYQYRNFYQFAFKQPTLAGHAFWHYIATNYKKDNVTYFLYLSVLYKNLNSAALRICKKKFKEVLADFMEKETEKYEKDIRGRRNYPKGNLSVTEDINENKDFYHFTPNPNPRSFTYAVTEYKKGRYTVALYENYVNRKVLIKNGIRVLKHEHNPNYPIMAWDGKGSRLATVYWEKDKVKLMVYDIVTGTKTIEHILPFDQVQDAQYFLDHKRMILSAVKNGHTDIYIYNLESQKLQQITNDVYDDIDAAFVSFPNKNGIIFASNRPVAEAKSGDTTMPGTGHYNIFLIDVDDKAGFRQITQLTNMKYGDARFPTQYNVNHFTFVASENGVGNRYAGFFTTKAEGLDTLFFIGDEVLRNPEDKELDSTLNAWQRAEPDSLGFIALTKDSTYTFPVTNYSSSLLESRIAGDKGQVSEVIEESDMKLLYRLRVDSVLLRRRNINARPTDYIKRLQLEDKQATGKATQYIQGSDTSKPADDSFLSEFENEKIDSLAMAEASQPDIKRTALETARLFKYKLKFSNDMILAGVTNNIVLTRYQPYSGGTGPIQLNNGNNLSWAFLASLSDVMEDYRITGGVKPGIDFRDNEYFIAFNNYRKRIDWGLGYYKASNSNIQIQQGGFFLPGKIFTTVYQGNVKYPFDEIRSLRLIGGYRFDRVVTVPVDRSTLNIPDVKLKYLNLRLEYVYDNSITKDQNIWNGLKYKFYIENISELKQQPGQERQFTFNFGADARYYYPIYRNFIWAVRAATDISWGNQKLIYYLGGIDNWISPKFQSANQPDQSQRYIYQTLAVNLRGYNQNVANGNNSAIINSELRLPVFTTFLNKPINNAFLRNFQLTQFFDFGTAWTGTFKGIERPSVTYRALDARGEPDYNNPVMIHLRAGGLGPFAGGYGFGARSTLLGYFMKLDAGWPMKGFFKGNPVWYFSLGLDF